MSQRDRRRSIFRFNGEFEHDPHQRPVPVHLPVASREQWRRLPVRYLANCRDIGGYQTSNGQRVKWGELLRSDAPSRLDQGDIDYLRRLRLRTIVDFRRDHERSSQPHSFGESIVDVHLPIDTDNLRVTSLQEDLQRCAKGEIPPEELSQRGQEVAKQLVGEHIETYASFFRELLADRDGSLLFHCVAGKDRTGFASAFILGGLGVPVQELRSEYLLSARYLEPVIDPLLDDIARERGPEWKTDAVRSALRTVFLVEQSWFDAGMKYLHDRYTDIPDYLSRGLGLKSDAVDKLRLRFLE